jgi:hypothetical protein
MDADEQQKREPDRPQNPTPDSAMRQTEHTESLHNEAPGENNDTVEPNSSKNGSNKPPTLPVAKSAAERFINIPELRLELYKHMANSSTTSVGEFSGLFLSCKAIHSEAETELVSLRKQYTDAEEKKWSDIWGLPVTISKPLCYLDLNNVVVTLPINTHLPSSLTVYGYRGLWGRGRRNTEWPMRDLALPRLETTLSLPNGHPRSFNEWKQIVESSRATYALLKASQLSPDPDEAGFEKAQCVTDTPLRARCFVFSWSTSRSTDDLLFFVWLFEGMRGWEVQRPTEKVGWMLRRSFEWDD